MTINLKSSKTYKIGGEIILIVSYLTQVLLFDYYDDKSKNLDSAYLYQSLIDKGAEIKELKYWVANLPADSATSNSYRQMNIASAARKIAQAQQMMIIPSEKPLQERIDLSNDLMVKANTVKDFDTYMTFIGKVNEIPIQMDDIISNNRDINDAKYLWRRVFIALYILGAVLVAYSIKFER